MNNIYNIDNVKMFYFQKLLQCTHASQGKHLNYLAVYT